MPNRKISAERINDQRARRSGVTWAARRHKAKRYAKRRAHKQFRRMGKLMLDDAPRNYRFAAWWAYD